MNQYKKQIREWQDLVIKLNESIQKNDFDLSDKLIGECNDIYNHYKECCISDSENMNRSFGELNYMLESNLPYLFKSNKKGLKECTNFVKNDKNLRNSFRFIDSLRNYKGDNDANANTYVMESINLSLCGIDKQNYKKSLNEFAKLLSAYGITKCDLDEETINLYKSCDNIICEKKSISNLNDYSNNINSIVSYITTHKPEIKECKNNIQSISDSLEKNIANLTEDEQGLVMDIIDFKNPMVEKNKEELFNRFKNECLNTIGELLTNSNDDEKNGLESIKTQIESKKYNKQTIVEDIAKLLEIRDILMEK